MSAILVIDHDDRMREQLVTGLRVRGFAVVATSDGLGGLALLRTWAIDAIVLEAALPNVDGISLVPLIRRITQIPIIMVSGTPDLATCIAALAAGADDYLPEPLDFSELAARVKCALRRPRLRNVDAITYEDLSLEITTREVHRGEHHIVTSDREFDLLLALARHPERVFSRTQLVELVWGAETEIQEDTVETLISRLRAKLDRPPLPGLIQTIRGVGYSLRLQQPKS